MHPKLERYVAQAESLHCLIRGLSPTELATMPPKGALELGAWSIQQVVVHLWHSDLAATHRMLRIACEERPLLIAYDETAHANNLHYNDLDLRIVCELFRLNRLHTSDILHRMPSSVFAREGIHNQRGVVTLDRMLEVYSEHVDHHAAFISRKRGWMGLEA